MRSSVAAARLLFLLLWLLVMTKSSGGGLVHFHFLVFIIFKESNCCAPSAFALIRFVGTVQAAVQCARGLAEAKELRQEVERGKEWGGVGVWTGKGTGIGIWIWVWKG